MVSLVRLGMPPLQAIRAATGKSTDLIAVRGDPLADITVLTHVEFVMKAGSVVKDERNGSQR
jgi:imidazolonepropionase-like amidohydrolase